MWTEHFFQILDVDNVQSTSFIVSHVVTDMDNASSSTLHLEAFQSLEELKSAIKTYGRPTYCHLAVCGSYFHKDQIHILSPYVCEAVSEHLEDPRGRFDGGSGLDNVTTLFMKDRYQHSLSSIILL